MDIHQCIHRLTRFAVRQGLIEERDRVWAANQLLGHLRLDALAPEIIEDGAGDENAATPTFLLEPLLQWAAQRGIIEDAPEARDRFDTLLMGSLTPRPSATAQRFWALYRQSPRKATDDFHRMGIACNYIRQARMRRNKIWRTPTAYGALDVAINLSKPEKDPRDIAKARAAPQTGYPRCPLCVENEGFFGSAHRPARQNLRLIPLTLGGRPWYFQYSPYGYYNEHCIVLSREHAPMRMNRETFARLTEFLTILPHYFAGSNADLPIVGGSILTHDHYQGGRYVFPMDRAPVEKVYRVPGETAGKERISLGRVRWPMAALRLRGRDPEALAALAAHILDVWRGHNDPEAHILAATGTGWDLERHNALTPIARRRGADYEYDLILRNNRTSAEHPLGVFHPHADLHHIKKENIGLIEALGLAILPARLLASLEGLTRAWLAGREQVAGTESLAAHDAWYRTLRMAHPHVRDAREVRRILRDALGATFLRILEDAGVYKRHAAGMEAFDRFVAAL